MKCPFLVVKKDVYDNDGKKIGEDIEIKECIKNECMVYDGATKLCSLLASNMKTGVLIDDMKNNLKSVHDAVKTQTKAFSEAVSTSIQTLQQSLTSRLDLLKKQNEVIVLGFDRIIETVTGKFEMLKTEYANQLISLKEAVLSATTEGADAITAAVNRHISADQEALLNLGQTNQTALSNLSQANQEALAKLNQLDTLIAGMRNMNELVQTELTGVKNESLSALSGISSKFDELRAVLTDAASAQEQSLQAILSGFRDAGDGIRTEMSDLKVHTAGTIEGLKSDLGTYFGDIKAEITGLKEGQNIGLNNVQVAFSKLEELFKQSSESLGTVSTLMRDLNNNYVESLARIAGLAEGMRKGVEEVGTGVHDSVHELIGEMKTEIGALEKQYEKTFADIASLAEKFGGLNEKIGDMTTEIQSEFKSSFDRQEKLSDYTQTILQHIKDYFDRQDVRYQEEQKLRQKKEGLDHFDRATLYFYRGNYELALNEIDKALEIEQTAEYLNLKGLLLTELGKFDESREIYKEALKMEPDLAEIHNNLGLLYLKMKKLDDAVVSFEEAVKKNINYAHAYANLGKALIDLENFDEAIKAFERALEIDPANRDAYEAIKLYKEGKIGG
jgi:tetratricopeptide (TPR) repeat protein